MGLSESANGRLCTKFLLGVMVGGSLWVICFPTGSEVDFEVGSKVGVDWLIRFLSIGVVLAKVVGSNCVPLISVGVGIVRWGMGTLVLLIIVGSLEQPIQTTMELKPKITNRYLIKTVASL